MAEWPKRLRFIHENRADGSADKLFDLDLIPADLGRELYEALKEAEWGIDRDHPVERIDAAMEQAQAALARYEREVGRQGGRDHDKPIGPAAPLRGPGQVNVGLTPEGAVVKLDDGPANYNPTAPEDETP